VAVAVAVLSWWWQVESLMENLGFLGRVK
jgi:hypothetical protein